jgi:hypothetical protein
MKRIQFVLWLLIALFVWTSQNTIIHFQHHDIEENSECIVCDTSEKIKLYQHNGHIIVINENLALNIRNEVKQVLVNDEFDYTDIPRFRRMDIVKYSQYPGRFIVPGINATAPPVYFS